MSITLTAVSTNFNNPIGIDYHPLSNKVLVSVNYPSGTPDDFELVASDGTRTQFSSVSGLTDEVKIATVRSSSCQGGFNAGELFVGTGTAGVIARISPDGSTVRNPWVTLSGETGLMRGGLFQDRFCAFGGDLIAVTTTGNVWRVNSAGTATRLATGVGGGAFLEGVTTVPNNSALYGPWAGKILTPAELQNLLYTVDAQGTVQSWNLGITLPEEVRVITANENFFGVDFSNRVVWGAGADQFASIVGDIVIPEETSTGRLWQVHWNAATSSFQTTVLAQVGQWEQITFAPAGVNPITSTLPTEPAPPFTALPGLPGTGATPDPVLTNAGSYAYSHTDLAIPGRGSSPAFARAYNGTDTRIGPLGPAWTHNYNIRLRNPGDGTADVILVNPNGRSDRYVFNAGTYTRPSGVTTQLVKNATGPNAYTATLLDQTAWNFDVGGRLTSIVDRYGNQSVLAYSATGRLVSVSDPAGRGSLALAYDPTSGLLTSVTDWSGRKVSYDYDTSGRLFHVADRNNQRTTFAYDGTSQRLTSITDANGHVAVSMTYDPQGRVATQKDARGLIAGQQTSFSYGAPDAQGNVTTTVTYPATSSDGFAPQQLDTYNPQSQIVTHVFKPSATESLTATYTYDANGFRKQVTDARGNTTSFCYDTDYTGAAVAGSHGNLTRVIAPPPAAGGNPLVTLVKFDAKNNVVETVAPRGVNAGVGTTCATNLSAAVNTLFATDLTYDTSLGTELLSVTRKYTDPDLGQQTATTKFAYGDAANPGLVTQVTPPRGNTGASPDTTFSTTLSYFGPGSQAGLLQSVTDPLGNKTTYAYDAVGRRTSLVDPLNNTWSFSYNNEDRLLSASAPAPVTGGAALTTQAQFDPVGNRITLTDANGQITRYLYDERDSLKQVDQSATVTDPNADPSKISAAYQYDNLGNLVRVDRATGSASEAVVDYAYDGLNRVRKETQYPQAGWPATPNGSTGSPTLLTQTTYDPNSNRQTLSDPQAQLTTFGYDTLNRLTSMAFTNAAPGTSATANVSYAYDANGNRTSLTDGTGSTSYTYDERDRLLSVTSPGPQTVGSRYDLDGNRTRVIYPDATAVTYTFDKASRLQSLADWVGRTTSYTYFADGLLNTSTNFNATTAQFSYDNARRLTQVTNLQTSTTPSSLISQHAYTLDAVGNRTHLDEQAPFIKVPIIPPCVGGCPPFALDPGAATQADDQAELQTASLAAMPLDQTASSPAAGAAPSAQRPLPLVDQSQDSSRTYQLRAEPAAYQVELFSKTSGQADVRLQHPASGTSLGFALLGSMTAHTTQGTAATAQGTTAPTQGTTASAQVGSATVRWTVFPHGLKEDVDLPARPLGDQIAFAVQTSGLSVDPDGHGGYRAQDSQGITRFHVLAPFAWDAAGHFGSATLNLQGASAVIQLDPTFLSQAVYPITVDPTIHFAIDYTYDHLYRLTAVSTSDLTDGTSRSASYTYDPLGNRLSKVAGSTTTNYAYDHADRITSAGGTSYTVNASGNLVARGTDSFGYDQASRLTSANVSGTTSTSVYDGDGKRARKTVGTTTTSYVYDVGGGMPVVLDDGTQKYIWGAGGLAYSVNKVSAAVAVYHTDGLGSARALSDSTGSVTQTYQTDEFGIPTLTQGSSAQPFGYTGEQGDPESGLLYLRARMYLPSIGRFLQADPVRKSGSGGLGWNRYAYAADNPLRFTDPAGFCTNNTCEQGAAGFGQGQPICFPGLPCIAPIPAEPTPSPKPGLLHPCLNYENRVEAIQEFSGWVARISGPEGGEHCHVNAEVQGLFNYHIQWTGLTFVGGPTELTGFPEIAASIVVSFMANAIHDAAQTVPFSNVYDWALPNLEEALTELTKLPPGNPFPSPD